MYLSKLILNPRSRQAWREIGQRYELHRTIMSAFPDDLDDDERVLFRVETDSRTDNMILLVQSHGKPDWSYLAEPQYDRYLLSTDEPNPWVKQFDPNFAEGQMLYFRLRANPTVKRDGKRRGLYREEEQLDWLHRKAKAGGFQVAGVRIGDDKMITSWVKRPKKMHRLRFVSVQFDGVLRVIDPAKLRTSIEQGIGSAKSFGFGLLSVRKPDPAFDRST